jgi:hypothetical protein
MIHHLKHKQILNFPGLPLQEKELCPYPADWIRSHGARFHTQGRVLVPLHVPTVQTRFRCQRALSSPRALWHRACHPSGNGSDVATCPAAPDLSPAREGSDVTTCLRHQDHRPTGLQYHHMSCGSRPASRCGRALEPPRALWPSAPEACPCVSKTSGIRLIMASPGTWSIQFIKCVQDKTYAAYG